VDASRKALGDVIVFSKYAKYKEELGRRETYQEIADRNRDMHLEKYKKNHEIHDEIKNIYKNYVNTKKILPSMRSMQFGGKPILIAPNRIYNCAFAPCDDYRIFSEAMFLLLGGTGLGYSVQYHHVEKLKEITPPTKSRRYLIPDSIEGWADAVKKLMEAYMCGKPMPRFDFSDIREKGALLRTSGGKAPGAQPLKDCLHNLIKILDSKKAGEKLRPIEVHDMMCHIADAVLAGGIRRAALISLFSMDDNEMLTCKFGNWWELNPQRGRSNNSAVILRHRVKEKDFKIFWEKVQESKSGEPGFYFTNNADWGTNPCCEIALRPFQFCNLTTINMNDVESQEDLNERARAAAQLGTLQAGYTDFHYLRDIWKTTTQKDGLLGVSQTGIAANKFHNLDLKEAATHAVEANKELAKIIGVNPAARITCIKPEGTTSTMLGCGSGIHGEHGPQFVRRIRMGKDEAIYSYLKRAIPKLVEDDFFKPNKDAVVSFPIAAPEGSIYRDEPALSLLDRVKKFSQEWIQPGHIKGDNSHNVSATISIKDDEWEKVGDWMWRNRDYYNGLAVLPYDGGTYKQAPFEEINIEKYNELMENMRNIDLRKVEETEDNTDLKGEVACAGGQCEIF
jgi:ribonucleoside-triphosphate reductase (thioredoxin)